MPKTLNPQNTFPTNIPNFPISGNNEPIAIEPLENAIQAVLNRSENLHVRLSEAETQGVKRVRTVASLAALSAATGFNNGDVCDVEGYGRYRLYNPSGLTADGLWVLNASGGGRWVHTLRDMRGAGNGLATLDSSQRLAQDVRDASILTQHIANQAVTSAKLAPGAVTANLGYTPMNRAGDTMTGVLKVTSTGQGGAFIHAQDPSASPIISLAIGDNDTGLHWNQDGQIGIYTNNSRIGYWNSFGLFATNRLITEGHAFINRHSSQSTFMPDISLAIGDSDTGLHWGGDGVIGMYANNQRIGYWNNTFFGIERTAITQELMPQNDNAYRLGSSGARWNSVWAINGTIQTSDAREKIDVQLTPLGLDFIERLRPVAYRWRVGGYVDEPVIEERQVQVGVDAEGNPVHETERHARPNPVPVAGKRLHHGLIAQEVKAALDELGVEDFGGWVLTDPADPGSQQALRYDQFVAPLIRAVQELSERLKRLEQKTRNNRRNA